MGRCGLPGGVLASWHLSSCVALAAAEPVAESLLWGEFIMKPEVGGWLLFFHTQPSYFLPS